MCRSHGAPVSDWGSCCYQYSRPAGPLVEGDEVFMAIAWMGHKAGLAF